MKSQLREGEKTENAQTDMRDGWVWESLACPLCAASSAGARLVHEFDESSYYRCAVCGLVYLNPHLTEPSMKQLYQSESYYAGDACVGYQAYETDMKAYRRTFERRFRELARFKPSGRLLDIGCGTGVSVAVATEAGYDAYGLDISDYATSVARRDFGSHIRTGTLESVDYPAASFDVVTMFDIFEHVYDPRACVAQLARITSDDGVIAIATPNYGSWMRRLLGSRCVSFKIPEHVCYYDRRSLERAVADHFHVIHIHAIGQYCTPTFLEHRLAELSRILGWFYATTVGRTGWHPYVPSGSMLAVLKKTRPSK